MRRLFLLICCLAVAIASAQQEKVYAFRVELPHESDAPEFIRNDGAMRYNGDDASERAFFSSHLILDFFQSYPSSKRQKTRNMFTFVTKSPTLMKDMVKRFPNHYLRYEDLTGNNAELQNYYPNDFGTFSPVANLGFGLDMRSFEYIGAPQAWDITLGDEAVIGIADAKIDTTDIDFKFKTTFLQDYYTVGFHSLAVSNGNGESYHGTGVTAIAAAQGNNGHGFSGVCSNCDVVATSYRLPTSPYTFQLNYDGLLQLADAGAQVINMSWRVGSSSSATLNQSEQDVIDELHDRNVVLVAAAGNENTYDYPNWSYYGFPASYNHVISVTGINYKNNFGDETTNVPDWGEVSLYVKDMVSKGVVTNYQGNGPYGFYSALTTNDKIDILAPGYQVPLFSGYLYNFPLQYGDATSPCAPYVTGTVGLMYSVNSCLINDEAEDILQLTSKRIEHLQGNEPWVGRSGSGKMETGDAVGFVTQMMSPTGNAVIDGQNFYRFDFKLEHINNKLTISNQVFRDANTSDFTARTSIEVTDSDFQPNASGFVELTVDPNVEVCPDALRQLTETRKSARKESKTAVPVIARLYPNPNEGLFTIDTGETKPQALELTIFDMVGKQVYSTNVNERSFGIDASVLPKGVYVVKLSGNAYAKTFKFIRK